MNYYLVDMENTQGRAFAWINKYEKVDTVSNIILFYTNNCQKLHLESLSNTRILGNIKSIRVPVGNQSLDSHLMSYLGYLLGQVQDKSDKFYIVSNDSDYDAVVEFWIDRGYDVCKLSSTGTNRLGRRNKLLQMALNKAVNKIERKNNVPGKLLNIISESEKQIAKPRYHIYTETVRLCGRQRGLELYNIIKNRL